LLVAGPWYVFAAANSMPTPDFEPISIEVLLANRGRWRTILELEWNSLTSQSWSYLWLLAGLIAPLLLVARRFGTVAWSALIPVASVIHLVLCGAVYFFSAFVPFEQHILSSIDRLIAPVVPLIVVWLALQAVSLTDVPTLSPHSSNPVAARNS
jgi:hypothetical protein